MLNRPSLIFGEGQRAAGGRGEAEEAWCRRRRHRAGKGAWADVAQVCALCVNELDAFDSRNQRAQPQEHQGFSQITSLAGISMRTRSKRESTA